MYFKFSNIRSFTKLKKLIFSTNGQSLAEFAVITAMMATFITTAMPKFSDMMESGKANKSIDELDKLLLQAKNFYETTAATEGRGRLPGQDKFDKAVGGYSSVIDVINDLETFSSFTNEEQGMKWVSVFGTENPKAPKPNGSFFYDDQVIPDVNEVGDITCGNCPEGRESGSEEWIYLFSGEVLISPFQDGHYIYVVIPSDEPDGAPTLFVADGESPKNLNKILDL
tara:strand:+ start:631 stop:1308 length:678 start_codon:yes stop_codon:yes gene_type:complete